MASDPTSTPMVVQIYNKLDELFGQGSTDIFQMEFPARLLEQGNFDYAGSDSLNAQQIKPPPVIDAEFRLANDMFALSNIFGGASGGQLADAYREVLFQLVPSTRSDSGIDPNNELKLEADQEKICAWLTELVDNFDPPSSDLLSIIPKIDGLRAKNKPAKYEEHLPASVKELRDSSLNKKIPRVDLYQKLLDIYEAEKCRWEQFKIDARPVDFSKQDQVNAYDRLLSSYAPVVDAKLEALWTLLLVRGELHRVRRYVGYIDVETASETLQRAKENLRASASRSIDDTQDIYPVVLTPSNWAKHLSTAFKPENLLCNEAITRENLYKAEKDRSLLILQRNALRGGVQDVKKLEDAEATARREYSQKFTEMTTGYSDTAINVIQLYFDSVTAKAQDKLKAIAAIGDDKKTELDSCLAFANISPLTDEQFKKLRSMQADCFKRQEAVQTAGEALSRAQMAAASARGGDVSAILETLEERIASLTLDIEFFKKSLSGSVNPLGASITKVDANGNKDKDQTPAPETAQGYNGRVDEDAKVPEQTDNASIWQEIVLTYKHTHIEKSTMTSTSVSHSNWSVGLFFGSASGSSDSASASSSYKHNAENTDIQIAMRVMKVSINRPWMNTNLLGQTQSFYHTNPTPISAGEISDVRNRLRNHVAIEKAEQTILPSWSTGFIVAKDVHIVMKSDEKFESNEASDIQKSANSGGGFLCFSCGKSESSSDHRTNASVTSTEKTLNIKIPAPQILGWICELAPQDKCASAYTPLPEREFATKTKVASKEMDSGKEDRPGLLPTPPPSR